MATNEDKGALSASSGLGPPPSIEAFTETEDSKKAEVAFDEALRNSAELKVERESFRSRASIVLSLANGFVGLVALTSRISSGGQTRLPEAITFWLGLAFLVTVIALVGYIYYPQSWRSNPMGHGQKGYQESEPCSLSHVAHYFAKQGGEEKSYASMLWSYTERHQRAASENSLVLSRMARATSFALIAMAGLLVCWIVNGFAIAKPSSAITKVEIAQTNETRSADG